MNPRILIAGIGNIFFADDAFGVEVARAAMRRQWPEGVRVVDFGIRALDLAYALCDGYDAVIMVDAVARGEAPGTLYVIEPEIADTEGANVEGALPDAHAIDPAGVLRLAAAMGGGAKNVLLLGCEPAAVAPGEAFELSAPVETAVDQAVAILAGLVDAVVCAAR